MSLNIWSVFFIKMLLSAVAGYEHVNEKIAQNKQHNNKIYIVPTIINLELSVQTKWADKHSM